MVLEQAVFVEIILTLSSVFNVPGNKIAEVLTELLAYRGIICGDKEFFLMALNLYAQQETNIVDCLLIVKAQTVDMDILSYNQKLFDPRQNQKLLQVK